MKRVRILIGLLVVVVFSSMVFAASGGSQKGDEALAKLMKGNQNFASGKPAAKDISDARKKELLKGQHPFAIVLSCSDSRVAPELVFDQALGDVFVVRVAGNIVDSIALGSIEYGAEHLESHLLVILGHTQCGAVKATLEAKGKPEGNIGAIIKKITPAVEKAKKAKKDTHETLNLSIKENIKYVYNDVMKSKIVNHLVHEGKLKIVGGIHHLDTGKVEIIDLKEAGKQQKK